MKLKLNDDQIPRELPSYSAVRRRYVFTYFVTICLGMLLYYMLLDIMQATFALKTSGYELYYLYYFPYYAGVIASAFKFAAKKRTMIFFNLTACVGVIVLAAAHSYFAGLVIGSCLIYFSGGYFDSITPVYLFETSPKEVFAVAGTFGYLSTTGGHFFAAMLLYIAYGISKEYTVVIALCLTLIFAAAQLVLLTYFGKTPLELMREKKEDECKAELKKMYVYEEGAEERFADIQHVDRTTDRYTVPIYKLILFPPRYRKALIAGLVIGFMQGVIIYFFETFVCSRSSKGDSSDLYCQEQKYDPSKGLLALAFIYLLVIGPVIFFLDRLEPYGRVRLFIFGTAATLLILLVILGFSFVSGSDLVYNWSTYVITGLILFYSIVVFSATLGPLFIIYIPEILPLPGVSLVFIARSLGHWFELIFQQVGDYSPVLMIGLLSGAVVFYWYRMKESRGLTDMGLYELYQDEVGKRDAQALREKMAGEPKREGQGDAGKVAEAEVVPKDEGVDKRGPDQV